MIQRIQSIWFLLVIILSILMYIFPFFTVHTDNATASLFFYGFVDNSSSQQVLSRPDYVLPSLLSIAVLLSIVAIFLFKNRILQMRITMLSALIFVSVIGFIAYLAFFSNDAVSVSYNWIIPIPLINIVLLLLARRAINKDEKLVKSMDRVR